jgi:imidazolonepropionase-like amidohydrolase
MSARRRLCGISRIGAMALALAGLGRPLPARAEAGAGTVAITGARVVTLGAAGTIENGTVVIEDGRIRAVGRDVAIPAGARRVDAAGKVVTPGLFDSLSHLGVVEVSAVDETNDVAVKGRELSVAFDVADALNPRSQLLPVTRVEGVTGAVVAPVPSDSVFSGRGAAIRLTGPGDLVVRDPVAVFASLDEAGAKIAGGSRAADLERLREALADARDYARHRAEFERNDRRRYSLSRLDLEALQPVLRGELPLVVTAQRASDLEAALRLARDFHLELILAGAAEGWMVAGEIAAARVPVLLDPMANLPSAFERLGATLENAARLARAGVRIAFMSGEAHNSRNLRQGAGNAVAYGLPWEEAVKAMTLSPARIWGLERNQGTLEPGKEADLVVWDGDPLELQTAALHVFLRGREVPPTTRQTELRDRYKTLAGDLPPAYRKP